MKEELPLGMIIWNMMKPVFRQLKKQLHNADDALTIEQLGLMHALFSFDFEVVQQDMAEMLGKDKSAILRMVDALEAKKYVQRSSNPNDRRKKVLLLTPLGEERLKSHLKHEIMFSKQLIEGIDKSALDTFFSVVEKIRLNAEKI